MGLLFDSPQDRARKSWASATRTKRSLEAAILELRQMERLLQHIEHDLPPKAPEGVLKNIQKSMRMTERHAEYTLKHMKILKGHIAKFEEHLR